MSKITVTTIAGLTSGGDANTVKIESGDAFQVVSGATTLGGDLTVDTTTLKVDSSNNRVGIGTTSPSARLDVTSTDSDTVFLRSSQSTTTNVYITNTNATANNTANLYFAPANNVAGSLISSIAIEDFSSTANRTADLTFSTRKDGTMSERMRLDSSGRLLIGAITYDANNAGVYLNGASGKGFFTASGDAPLAIHRLSSDGDLVELRQANNTEGTISVSGSTVSYNGFSGQHETSGIATNTEIGTVVSTIDELDTYFSGDKKGQTRADHAKVKVSDSAGDNCVYGVVSRFDSDGKAFIASVGIGSVRVTGACAKGDLLESNGDGTAKVQSDDIIRSKTLGKVTIGNSDTKEKLVSCVLYCG